MRRLIPIVALLLILAGLVWLVLDRVQRDAPAKGPQPPRAATAGEPALPALAGQVLQSGCRQGQCVWLRVARFETVSASSHGELRRLTARRGLSRYDDESPATYSPSVQVSWDARDASAYAYCSGERPAYAFADEEGGLVLHYLDLFDLAGYQQSSATMYMRLCHDIPSFYGDAVLLRSLGYRPGTRNEQVEGGAPEDLALF